MACDLTTILKVLAERRPVFHSEADFQHALAWLIHEHHPTAKVRLEYRPARLERKTYVDIWIEQGDEICAIELKYKTRRLQATVGEEPFDLMDQSAQDIARYDFCKDIGRIEALTSAYPGLTGFAVLLTNDRGYWRKSRRGGNVDDAFRLHEATSLSGRLAWADHASDGTTKGRNEAICLQGEYRLSWTAYSTCDGRRNSEFRMAIVGIGPVRHVPAVPTVS